MSQGDSISTRQAAPITPSLAGNEGKTPYGILFAGIVLVSFATLLFEVSLIRVLSYTVWHHFGYVIISTALLGFAASGSFLAVASKMGTGDLRSLLGRCSLLSALAAIGTLVFFCLAPLDPMKILDDPWQAFLFLAYQVGTAVPFFFAGLVVSLSMREAAARVDRLYFWDLLGAGLGCASAVTIMNWLTPPGAAAIAASVFAGAAIVFTANRPVRAIIAGGICLSLLAASMLAGRLPFRPAQSKELAIQVRALGSIEHFTRWTALFRTDVIEQTRRLHDAERCPELGVSPKAPPDCQGPRFIISHDATAGAPMYALRDQKDLSYLDYDILRVPYLVTKPRPRVLVIGMGGGRDVVVAHRYGASNIVGVELDPVTVEVVHDVMNDVTDGFFRRPDIQLVAGEGRHFVRTTDDTFDLIQITGADTLSAEFSGAYVLAESYLYTVEAVREYLDRLGPGGILSFESGDLNPNRPRAAGRMVSLALEALRSRGVEDPWRHIAVIDSRRLAVEVLVNPEPFDEAQVQRLADHAAKMQFVPLWLPGRDGHPVFHKLVTSAGTERERLLDELSFRVAATTDDDPFFFFFFRWGALFNPGTLTPSHTTALGQIVLGALLVTLSALGVIFVLGPLLVLRRREVGRAGWESLGILGYFVAVGIGFMLFEISFIQRFVLFLGYPTYSLSVTLFGLLVSLGWGSFISRRWVGHERTALPVAVCLIAALVLFYMWGLPGIQSRFVGSSLSVRVAISAAVIAPLGLVLGMFLPLGIRRAAEVHTDLVPWAWGVNGCASVTGGVLAVVLGMSFGFSTVWMLSVLSYVLGVAALLLSLRARSETSSQN